MKKNTSYEAFRFLFFLFVFLYHCKSVFEDSKLLRFFSHSGLLAVSSFFILSGFVTGLSCKKEVQLKNFSKLFLRRIMNFYPVHVLFMIFGFFLDLHNILSNKSLLFIEILSNIFLIQSWFPSVTIRYSLNGVAWYLSTYVFLSFISFFVIKLDINIKKNKTKIYCFVILLLFVLSFILSSIIQSNERFWLYAFPPIRLIDYLCGFFLARICLEKKNVNYTFQNKVKFSFFEILSIILYLCCLGVHKLFPVNYSWQTIYLLPSLLLFYSFFEERGVISCFISRYENVFLYLGGTCFYYYISHQIIIRFVYLINDTFKLPGYSCILISLLLTICVSELLNQIRSFLNKKRSISNE